MTAFRSPVSGLMIGVSVWCAAGTIAVASPESAAVRLAVPAGWWWFVAPALLALCVPGWRYRPLLAAPALVSTLPWWPVPVPAAAMMWTGPLAWVPIAAAVAAGLAWTRGERTAPDEPPRGGRPSAWPAALATLALGAVTAAFVTPRVPGGDEPHYLIITQSLIRDGDLRIENNHANRDYAAYFGGNLWPDFVRRGEDGEIYSIHAPGMSVLVLPAFAVFGYDGARATLLLVSAAAGGLIWSVAWLATGRRGAAWFAWAAIACSATFLLQSGMVFPDGAGALGTAAGVWLWMRVVRGDVLSTRALVGVGAALAALPWLHTRFAVLAGGFGMALLWVLWREAHGRLARVLTFLAVPLAVAAAWFGFFYLTYGTANPAAPYGGGAAARFAYVPGGLLALAFDQQFGLIPHTPVLALAVAGLAGARTEARAVARGATLILLAYAAAVTTYWMWWAGLPATPARFLNAALPVLSVPVALAWAGAGRTGRVAASTLLVASLAIGAVLIGVDRGELAWNDRDAQALWLEWLSPVANLPRAWPSFFWRLVPEDLTTELPFAVHVGAWLAAVGGAAAAGTWLVRTRFGGWHRSAATAAFSACLMAGLMAAGHIGWWLNDVTGLDPARAQLSVLTRAARGQAAWRISPIGARRLDDVGGAMRVHSEEPGRADANPPWALLTDVPAGRYQLILEHVPPDAGGDLIVRVGRSERPLRVISVRGRRADPTIWLPAGAQALVIEPDEQLAGHEGRIVVVPLQVERNAGPPARLSKRFGDADIFLLDNGAFAETTGFWIRGAATAAFVVAPDDGRAPIPVRLRNGGAVNAIEVWTPLGTETFSMEPFEERTVPLPAPGPGRALDVRIGSAGGFRPSDVSASGDRRLLGVWMEVGGQ